LPLITGEPWHHGFEYCGYRLIKCLDVSVNYI
jgi:hypothetical protein